MKICILHLYSDIFTGGEYTFGLHLSEGFRQLGHESHLVVFSKTGEELKNFRGKNFKIYKEKDRIEALKTYDFIFILDGYLKNPDYSFLKKIHVPMCVMEHNALASYRRYQYNLLFDTVGQIPVFGYKSARIAWKKKYDIDVHIIRQPFEPKLLPQFKGKKETDILKVCFPHRFSTNKHPEVVYNFFVNEIQKKIKWQLYFYGSRNESVVQWTFLKNEIDSGAFNNRIFKDKRVYLYPAYNPIQDLAEIYYNTNLTAHSTKYAEDGGRMEYALLESIYYRNPICSYGPFWAKNGIIDTNVWIKDKSYIEMNEDSVLKFYKDKTFRTVLLESSTKIVEKYFNAKNIAKKILSVVFD